MYRLSCISPRSNVMKHISLLFANKVFLISVPRKAMAYIKEKLYKLQNYLSSWTCISSHLAPFARCLPSPNLDTSHWNRRNDQDAKYPCCNHRNGQFSIKIIRVIITVLCPTIDNRQLLWCQLCRHWWQSRWRLPVTTASDEKVGFMISLGVQ